MKPRVYLETTIISYFTSKESADPLVAGHQIATQRWWDERSSEFELYISEAVVEEASLGDADAARRRLEILSPIPELEITNPCRDLAETLLAKIPLPPRAEIDALHIAVATFNAMGYLLTWNCSHIANAMYRHPIEAICRSVGYEPPVICTPLELLLEE